MESSPFPRLFLLDYLSEDEKKLIQVEMETKESVQDQKKEAEKIAEERKEDSMRKSEVIGGDKGSKDVRGVESVTTGALNSNETVPSGAPNSSQNQTPAGSQVVDKTQVSCS